MTRGLHLPALHAGTVLYL